MAVGPVMPLVAKSTADAESVALELGSVMFVRIYRSRGSRAWRLTVAQNSGDVVVAEEGEGKFQPSYKVGLGIDGLGDEERTFVGVVSDK
jgi:hypothetical protein